MAWSQEELNEIQTYLQMYDKMLISRETVLERIGIDAEEELKKVKKDIEFNNKRKKWFMLQPSSCQPCGQDPWPVHLPLQSIAR